MGGRIKVIIIMIIMSQYTNLAVFSLKMEIMTDSCNE